MDFYKWISEDKKRLKKRNVGLEMNICIEKEENVYKVYGRYTPHDNYMGHPYSENLLGFEKLLEQHGISYQLVENKKGMIVSEFYAQLSTYIQLDRKEYQQFKNSTIL